MSRQSGAEFARFRLILSTSVAAGHRVKRVDHSSFVAVAQRPAGIKADAAFYYNLSFKTHHRA